MEMFWCVYMTLFLVIGLSAQVLDYILRDETREALVGVVEIAGTSRL
jgi:hypothetical protein